MAYGFERRRRGMSRAQGVSPGRVAIKGIHSLSLWERVRVREFLTGTDPRVRFG